MSVAETFFKIYCIQYLSKVLQQLQKIQKTKFFPCFK